MCNYGHTYLIYRQDDQLLHDGFCQPCVPLIVGMQAVVSGTFEVRRHLVHQGIEAAERVEVNHGHRPKVS